MPTLAAGNKQRLSWRRPPRHRRARGLAGVLHRGFTLIELLVVLAIIALGTAGVSLSLRESAHTALERDAQRLATLLETARARSRASGVPVAWRVQSQGDRQMFVFDGLPGTPLANTWLDAQTRSLSTTPMLLGPEPLIGAQSVTLSHAGASSASPQLWVSTDGLRPYTVHTRAP